YLGVFRSRRGDHAAALAAVDAALARVTPRCAALFAITAAAVAERAGRAADAAGYAARATALAPGAAPVLDAAETYYAQRGDDTALAALRAAELQAPLEDASDYTRRASRWLGERAFDRALATADEGMRRFGRTPRLAYDAAAATLQLGDREGAAALLAAVPPADPEIAVKAAFLRSIVLADLNRPAEALGAIDVVLAAAPGHAEATLHRTKLLAQLHRDDEIEAALRAALPSPDGRIAVELAGRLMAAGRFTEARRIAEDALK
ncbi:MAG: hypothetical protein ABR591_15235, partial [Candidatus Velthaea sp.]